MKVKKVRITARQVREKARSRALLRKRIPSVGLAFRIDHQILAEMVSFLFVLG